MINWKEYKSFIKSFFGLEKENENKSDEMLSLLKINDDIQLENSKLSIMINDYFELKEKYIEEEKRNRVNLMGLKFLFVLLAVLIVSMMFMMYFDKTKVTTFLQKIIELVLIGMMPLLLMNFNYKKDIKTSKISNKRECNQMKMDIFNYAYKLHTEGNLNKENQIKLKKIFPNIDFDKTNNSND